MTLLADVRGEDLTVLFVLVALLCLGGAAYCAYVRNVIGAAVLVFIAVVALIFGT